MDHSAPHGQSTGVQVQQAGRLGAFVQFLGDGGARVVVEQPEDATDAERAAYNSAHRQCWLHIVSHAPREFSVTMTGNSKSPKTEVHIESALLNQLPLLCDAQACASASAPTATSGSGNTSQSNPAALQLPCSVWGLVSLLLLLEGSMTVAQWFDSDKPEADAALPAQTLEVLSYTNI